MGSRRACDAARGAAVSVAFGMQQPLDLPSKVLLQGFSVQALQVAKADTGVNAFFFSQEAHRGPSR